MKRMPAGLVFLILLDLAAIAFGAALPDLYLRPLLLLLMAATAFLSSKRQTTGILIALGLLCAGAVETLQMLGLHFRLVAAGTALYYAAYAAAFWLAGGSLRGKGLAGFGIMSLYCAAMFLWLDPYGMLRLPSIVYTIVLALLGGLGLRPILQNPGSPGARWMAAAVVLLTLSDTTRAISIFKTAIPEVITLALYWAGQFAMVKCAEIFSSAGEKFEK